MVADILSLDEETLKAPESRVHSILGVRARIGELKSGEDTRKSRRTKVQGLIDGNQPYSQTEMVNAGRGDDANVNFREAEGMVESAKTPYYDLVFEIPKAVNIYLEYGDNQQRADEWGKILETEYTRTLWDWDGYDIQTQLSQWQMVVHGHGPIMWRSPRGWHFESKRAGQVCVADDALCDIDRLEEMSVPGHYDPVQLFKLIDKGVAASSGWNVKLAKWAIIKAAPDSITQSFGNSWTEDYQISLRRGDVAWSNKSARIYYTDYLVKEFSGKVTHVIVLDKTPDEAGPEKDGEEDGFLFKKKERFESFNQIINPYFYDVGPAAEWHQIKGLGPKIFDFCDISNRFNCTLINGAMAMAGIPLKSTNAQAMQKLQQTPIVRTGGLTLLPPDWDVQNLALRGQMDGPLAVKRELQMTVQSNTGQYRQRISQENQEPTLGQAELNAGQQATLSKGAFNRFYRYEDRKHKEIIRRMLDSKITDNDCGGEAAKEMIERCLKKGVPKEALKFENICSIKAVRNIGYGSAQMQQIVSRFLMELLPTMDEEGRNHALRTMVAPYVGQEHVDRFYKKIEDAGIPDDHAALATLENNALRQIGGEALVTPAQNAPTHFAIHFADAMEHVKELQAGKADPIQVLIHLDQAGPHIHEHLESMAGDPTRKAQYDQMQKAWLQLAKLTDGLKNQVAKAQAEKQPARPQMDPEMIKGLFQIHSDIALKDKALNAKIERDNRKYENQTRLKDLMTADNIYRKNAEAVEPEPEMAMQ